MNRTVLSLLVGLACGAAAGAAGGYLAGSAAAPVAPDGPHPMETEAAKLRKQVDVLERKLARKSATPLEAFSEDMRTGGSSGPYGGPALDEASRMVADLLRGLSMQWHAPWMLVDSGEEMSRFFARVADGPVVEGHRTGLDVRPADGATIRFPAGRHALDARTLSRFDPFPREIVFEGAGMDSTLLVMNDDIRPSGQVFHLRIKNATVNTNGGRLLRAGTETFSVRLENCRVVGFDGGRASGVVSGERGAVFATDCRFETGYADGPAGVATVMAVGDALLARFERCTFVGPFAEPFCPSQSSAQVYADCQFESMAPHFRPTDERYKGTVRVQECGFDYVDERTRRVTRSLSEINDSW